MPRNDPSPIARFRGARTGLICLGLALLTLAAFRSLPGNEFIKFDDRQYVTENPHVTTGLTWENVKWAFRTGYASNWHPLTWLSHMVDVQLFGLSAGGHHLTSLLLHAANAVLLFLVLQRMTLATWRSALVAAFFAVHPLHVESVAWAAERKDVLSTLFFLLTLLAYAAYTEEEDSKRRSQPHEKPAPDRRQADPAAESLRQVPSFPRGLGRRAFFYALALLLFALGLMSKPMLVTLPFLLLLLDWWPLARLQPVLGQPNALFHVFWEKVPFLLLAGGSIVVTLFTQAGSHSITTGLPLRLRVANAVVSYIKYLGKTVWPANLAIFYPHPNTRYGLTTPVGYPPSEQWRLGLILVAAVVLLGISCLALLSARARPWLALGWFWFLGTLVPVIGLVQIGMQAMADRYSYIPLIGLFICIVWGSTELLAPRRYGNAVLAVGGVLAVLVCAAATHRQVRYWRTNLTVFAHALKATKHNAVADCNVGEELAQEGKLDLAQEHFRAALKSDPRYPLAYMDLAISLEVQGKLEQALEPYQTAVRLRPWSDAARVRLAGLLKTLGRPDEALAQYTEALQHDPAQPLVEYQVGTLLAAQRRVADAVIHLRQAARLKPDYAQALIDLGTLLAGQGKFREAQAPFRQAVALCPTNAALHLELGKTLMLDGKSTEAAPEFAETVRLAPNLPGQLLQEGRLLSSRRQLNGALARFNVALWLTPDSPDALTEMAWILATHPLPALRDGPRALRLARRALQLNGGSAARSWAALDAAYAEAKRFPEAISAAEKAREIALSTGDTDAAQACDARLALYRNQRPFHQEAP